MTPRLKSMRLRMKTSGRPVESGVTFGIPTVTRTASRPVLDRGGREQDPAKNFTASPQGELRRAAGANAKAVTS